ncbi:unnamed protein product [Orchesella dallaii]|uniref:BHLH domain-containing protein n=1 Tax=Orchesella dallaii TaxID=48710 RepID=A0ABP1Q2V3_9HEXA
MLKEENDFEMDSLPLSPNDKEETEEVRRHRRLVANSNERRRMQGINNGFEALRGFLACGDEQKLSKAAILQKTVTFIQQLLNEKSELIIRNAQMEKLVSGGKVEENPVFAREVFVVSTTDHAVPIIKQEPVTERRRKRKASTAQLESVDDEGVASLYSEHSGSGEDLQSEVAELREETKRLRLSLENERLHRRNLEAQIRNLQLQNQSLTETARFAQDQYTGKMSMSNLCPSTPGVIVHDETPRCRTVSRNNLESIVEAIRRLEGDHLFADDDDHNLTTPSPGSPSAAVEEVEITATEEFITP